jgi:hypothetical protein
MDAKRWNIANSSLGVIEHACKFTILFNNDFSSETKITVEPSSPETTSIGLDVELLETTFGASFSSWCKLEDRRVSMTSDTLE